MEDVKSCLTNMMDLLTNLVEKASLRTVSATQEAINVVSKGDLF